MNTRPHHDFARALTVAVVASVAWGGACEDRGVPEDVPHARTGGTAQRPGVGNGSRVEVSDTGRGPTGVSGVPGGPQGAGGTGFGGGAGGTGGTGGAAATGAGGSAGIPGLGGAGGSAGIPGPAPTDPEDATVGDATGNAGAPGNLGIGGAIGGVGTNFAPVASFSMSPPCVSEIQTAVTLASSSVDPDGDPLQCSWVVPGAVPNSAEDCAVTVTLFDALESSVVLFVDDGTRVSTAMGEIAACPNVGG